MNDQPATAPTLADQVAAIDATAVASQIMAYGARAAIGASTVEIVAMAKRLLALSALADLTFDMLATADAVQAERNLDNRKVLQRTFKARVDFVGVSLEALGYGQQQQPAPQQEEKNDGTN